MIELKTKLNQIEINADGRVQFRIEKQVMNGGMVISSEWHRSAFAPESDSDAQIELVNGHLAEMGFGPISEEDAAKLRAFADFAATLYR